MMGIHTDPRFIIAFDFNAIEEADTLLQHLDPRLTRIKVGKAMFVKYGPNFVKYLQTKGFEVFLDLKFHDIPNTVYNACKEAAHLNVWMLNVHALGGRFMLEQAVKAVQSHPNAKKPLLIGVTLLTSLHQDDLTFFNQEGDLNSLTLRLAGLCYEAGLQGVVCSAHEVPMIKQEFGKDFICVTPGVRLDTQEKQDQKRVATPKEAFELGADYIVIGRALTQSNDPKTVLEKFFPLGAV
ncbi:MAG TPA: orotidine-5'-phosphate decarboxylase [Gammaproteobacteria bacterium]|nr:orotidine-5'-phosphate decarboxylase [Gammaproteobacteria bacterium]